MKVEMYTSQRFVLVGVMCLWWAYHLNTPRIWKELIRQLIFHVGFMRKHKKLLYHLFGVLDVSRYWALWYMNEKVAMVICNKIHLVQKIWDYYFAMCFIPSWWVSLDKIHLLAGYIVWNVLYKSKIYFLVHENWMFQYGTVSVHLWWKSRFTKYMQIRGNYDMGLWIYYDRV